MAKRTVMRMMALRALRPLRPKLRIDLGELPQSEFLVALRRADSLDAVVGAATQFVKGPNYLPNAKQAEAIELLNEGGRVMARSGNPIDAGPVQAYAQGLPAAQKQMFQNIAALVGSLADSFVAACYASGVDPAERQALQVALRAAYTITLLRQSAPVPQAALSAPIILPPPGAWQSLASQGGAAGPGTGGGGPAPNPIRPAGIGDLLVVREEMVGYERTQIAHVENVMASETRDRVHRKLDRITETTVSETETNESATRDLQSTQRSEVSQEISRTVSEQMSLGAGVEISAKYGPVLSVDASADFAYETAREEAATSASNFAQEVIDKSVTTVSERRLNSTTRTVLAETEETNSHGFDNAGGAQHIVGVYRWLDQRWRAQVMNYGRRLLMEFNVPQPAHVFLAAQDSGRRTQVLLPQPPRFDVTPDEISETLYLGQGARFGAGDLPPPPAEKLFVDVAVQLPETFRGKIKGDDYNIKTYTGALPVTSGYLATWVRVDAESTKFLKDNNDKASFLKVIVGNRAMDCLDGEGFGAIENVADTVDIAVYAYDLCAAVLGIRVTLTRTTALYEQWQLACWTKMKEASDRAWRAYNAEVAASANVQSVMMADTHPDAKRGIERVELKRGALEMLTQQHFVEFNPLVGASAVYGVKDIDVPEALKDGRVVSFFEQCFEWEQMTYLFYPYFWGDKSKWKETLNRTDPDPAFAAFLAAGSSRVQVPVRPGFERAMIFFLATGRIWMGRDAPVLGSPLYVPIVEEIAEAKDVNLDKALPYGEPWEYTVPTSLVVLDADASAIPA